MARQIQRIRQWICLLGGIAVMLAFQASLLIPMPPPIGFKSLPISSLSDTNNQRARKWGISYNQKISNNTIVSFPECEGHLLSHKGSNAAVFAAMTIEVLVLDLHLEDGLLHELETQSFLKELKRERTYLCASKVNMAGKKLTINTRVSAVISDSRTVSSLSSRKAMEHTMAIDSLYYSMRDEKMLQNTYDAVVLAPGSWRLCKLRQQWPHRIDILMAGSILPEACDLTKAFAHWKPALIVVREPYSYGRLLMALSTKDSSQPYTMVEGKNVDTYMSGDLSHSFQPAPSKLEYWKKAYANYGSRIVILCREFNASTAISWKLPQQDVIQLRTLMFGNMAVPASNVIFATALPSKDSSLLDRSRKARKWPNEYIQDHQFVECQTVEQLIALISHSQEIFTDQYHAAVIAYRYNKNFTILSDDLEQSELVGLYQLTQKAGMTPTVIRDECNRHAFDLMHSMVISQTDHDHRVSMQLSSPSYSTLKRKSHLAVNSTKFGMGNQSEADKSDEKPLAIVVGLPKSGTTSVYHFFSCSGYRTTHYCCCGSTATEYPCKDGKLFGQQLQDNLREDRSLWHGIGQMEVHTQIDGEQFIPGKRGSFGDGGPYFLPQHYNLDELERSAPEAVWILPLRPAAKWKKSVQSWLDMEARFRQTFIEHGGKRDESSFDLETFYENHTNTVRNYCHMQRQNPNLCIEINIDQQDAGSILKEFFPRAISSCWGRHNAGPFFQSFPGKSN